MPGRGHSAKVRSWRVMGLNTRQRKLCTFFFENVCRVTLAWHSANRSGTRERDPPPPPHTPNQIDSTPTNSHSQLTAHPPPPPRHRHPLRRRRRRGRRRRRARASTPLPPAPTTLPTRPGRPDTSAARAYPPLNVDTC